MQQYGKLCSTRWLLVILLSWNALNVSVGNPIGHFRQDSLDMDNCLSHSRALLWKITDALQHENLFSGINCTEQSADMNTRSETVSACEPNPRQNTSCIGQRRTKFDKNECLKNIEQDVQYYRSALQRYSDHALGSHLVEPIDDFRKHCFSSLAPKDRSMIEVSPVIGNTFEERLKLCKAMNGLRVRAITISRVMSYIAAEDYKM